MIDSPIPFEYSHGVLTRLDNAAMLRAIQWNPVQRQNDIDLETCSMTMRIHPHADLAGDYDLRELDTVRLDGAHQIKTGIVRIARGTRSPVAGLRAGADHEIGYVVSGQIRVETEAGIQFASRGDTLVASPDIPHATTALEDTVIFFALAIRCQPDEPAFDPV